MAVNPYYPTAVGGSTSPYTGQSYTNAVPLPSQQYQQSQTSLLTIFVNSEEEVNFYPVAAGVTVILICFRLQKFWLKSTGNNGVPEPLRVFSFNEETAATDNDGSFVTKDEFNSLSMKLDQLISNLGGDK